MPRCECAPDLDAPSNLRAIDQTEDSITLEWKNSQANVPSYRIKYGPLSGGEHGELTFPSGIQDITKAKISGKRYHIICAEILRIHKIILGNKVVWWLSI